MAKIVSNKRSALFDEEIDVEELGAETEAERQMKIFLEKQLNTKISLTQQFSQHRTFVSPSTFTSLTELVHGTCSLEKFKEIEKDEEVRQELQRCGLADEEIEEYLNFKSQKGQGNRIVNPEVQEKIVEEIEEKIKSHNEELLKPQEFKNVKKLTRHEMEIESTLYSGCAEKNKLSALVSMDRVTEKKDDAFSYIKALSEKLAGKFEKGRKKKRLKKASEMCESSNVSVSVEYDPDIHHVIVPLDENEVSEKRLAVEEIRKLPRFEQYDCGQPSKILYLKNLHPKSTVDELRAIFGQFEEENSSPINYKLCTGRMKGQAFVTFLDSIVSQRALEFANGYMLRGKPIIIAFGKKS